MGQALADDGVGAAAGGPGQGHQRQVGLGDGRWPLGARLGRGFAAAPDTDAHHRPLVGQGGLQHPPALVELTQPVGVGYPGVGEEHLVEAAVAGDLAQRPHLDAGLAHGEEEERDAPVLGLVPVGAGDEQRVVGLGGARRPHLLAVDHPFVAVPGGRGLQPGQVGAGPRFGVQQAHPHVGQQQGTQELPFQLVPAVGQHGVGPEVQPVVAGAGRADGGERRLHDLGGRVGQAPAVPLPGPAGGAVAGVDDQLQPLAAGPVRPPVLTEPALHLDPHRGDVVGACRGRRSVAGCAHVHRPPHPPSGHRDPTTSPPAPTVRGFPTVAPAGRGGWCPGPSGYDPGPDRTPFGADLVRPGWDWAVGVGRPLPQ